MDRRTFLICTAAAVAGARSRQLPRIGGSPVTAKVAGGVLRGETVGGVNIFRGVPFAQPPIGELRFRAPQPMPTWSGVREATQFAAEGMQPGTTAVSQSEDCLYLNVWAPADVGLHPVFVWIHGGGFVSGRSFGPDPEKAAFAQQGIVCVTIAYRLGVFGFLDFDSLLGSAYVGSANNALRDIIMALQWVKTNIRAFGGDPDRVTVGGESAGAKLTGILMGVPAADGLFQQAISESGGAERVWPTTQSAASVARSFAETWKLSGQPVAALKTASAEQIVEAEKQFLQAFPLHFPLRPEIDGALIPRSPLDTIRAGSTRGKRLLLGTNRDESALFIGPHPQNDPGARQLGNLTVEQFQGLEASYARLYPNMSTELRRIRSLTAEEYWIPSMRLADAEVRGGGTAFVYRFDYSQSTGRYAGLAFHSSELAYVWDRLAPNDQAADDLAIARTIHAAWCAFISGEPPNASGLPAWPRYSPVTRPTMILNTVSRVEDAPEAAEFALWSGLMTCPPAGKRNRKLPDTRGR